MTKDRMSVSTGRVWRAWVQVLGLATAIAVGCGGKVVNDICHSDSDCPSGYTCQGGDCAGPPPVVCKDGQVACGPTCFDLARDAKNCGSCGHACDAGLVCSSGTCAAECAIGLVKCGST